MVLTIIAMMMVGVLPNLRQCRVLSIMNPFPPFHNAHKWPLGPFYKNNFSSRLYWHFSVCPCCRRTRGYGMSKMSRLQVFWNTPHLQMFKERAADKSNSTKSLWKGCENDTKKHLRQFRWKSFCFSFWRETFQKFDVYQKSFKELLTLNLRWSVATVYQ